MSTIGLEDFINEFETFCRKRKLEYKLEDRGVVIKNYTGVYNIHIYMKWDNYDRAILGFILGDSIYSMGNPTRYEETMGYVTDMLIVRSYLQNTYPSWLVSNRDWKSRSKYK